MTKDDVARIAAAAEFHVAPYDDCGTARLTVRYDTTPPANPRADCRDQGGRGRVMIDYQVLQRPNWWREGLPLPALVAGTEYSGKGKIRSGGRVVETLRPVRWETVTEWKARTLEQERRP